MIRTFEPRLLPRSIQVEYVPVDDKDDFRMHFRIQALLHMDPIVEPVSFDTSLELECGAMRVVES